MKNVRFDPEMCTCCGQTKNYALPLDRGSALFMIALANAVRRLNRNKVHLAHEMLTDGKHDISEGYMNMRMMGNAARPRYHGLIAFVNAKGTGEYLITRKGAKFLHGMLVERTAIIDKSTGHNAGYWSEGGEITIGELLKSEQPMWEGALKNGREYFEEMTDDDTLPLL